MHIRLIVLRTSDQKKLADFYSWLGLVFEQHQHGNLPCHYAATVGTAVLELYPLAKGQPVADKSLRLGLELDDFAGAMERLRAQAVPFLTAPAQADFGFMAIISDSDGRKIELYRT